MNYAGKREGRRPLHRRAGLSIVTAVGVLALGAGTAWASSTAWTTASPQTVTGLAQFTGQYKWWSNGDHSGAFEIKGTVADLNKSNGRRVKFQVRPENTTVRAYNATTDQNLTVPDNFHVVNGQSIVRWANIQTCQVNVLGDDCTTWRRYDNPFFG